MNTNRIYGRCRDEFIVEIIEKMKCLDAEQIRVLFFDNCNPKSTIRQQQNVMRRLSTKKTKKEIVHPAKVKKERSDLDQPYKYFINDFSQKEHIVLLNWVFIHYLIKHQHEQIYYMEYQRDYKIKVPDLFLVTFNPWLKQNQYKATMFEMDRTVTNKFDAVEKMNKLFESKPNDEFVQLTAPKFPSTIIATTDKNRLNEINRLINNPKINKNKLQFIVHSIWDLREECKNEKITNFRSKFISTHVPARISIW